MSRLLLQFSNLSFLGLLVAIMTRVISSLASWYELFRDCGLSLEDAISATVGIINHSNWLINSIHLMWVAIHPLGYMLHISSSLIPMLLILSLTLAIASIAVGIFEPVNE